MKKLSLSEYKKGKLCKNVLYEITDNVSVSIREEHETPVKSADIVWVDFEIKKNQYGILGHEYRSALTAKKNSKSTDVFACIVDEERKTIYSLILDMKRNISAFSDDLEQGNSVLTATKEVKEFIQQLQDENRYRKSLFVLMHEEECTEIIEFGIATRSFEAKKFQAVAECLERVQTEKMPEGMSRLLWLKKQNSLLPYTGEISKLKDFASKKVTIDNISHDLKVYILEKENNREYIATIPICL